MGEFYAGAGTSDAHAHVFVATNLTNGDHEREVSEVSMETGWYSLEAIDELIQKGELTDGWSLVAMYLFRKYLENDL